MITLSFDEARCKLLVHFPYKPEFVDRIKLFPGRVWKRPFWVLPMTSEMVQDVEAAFRPFDNVVKDDKLTAFLRGKTAERQEVLAWKQDGSKLDIRPGTRFHVTPYNHQKSALALVQNRNAFALFMEMGTGKTKVVVDHLGNELSGTSKPVLVVAPLSVVNNWEREFKMNQPHVQVVVAQGSANQKLQALNLIKCGTAQVIVINYESLWRLEEEFEINWHAMVLDESTRIKNRTTQQAKAIIRLGKRASKRYILTGTPSPNSPLELYNQIRFLDESVFGSSWYAYRDRYAIMGGYGGYQVLGWKNLPELTQKLAAISFRVLKKDCLDLPEKVYQERRLPMDAEQGKVYKELAEDLVTSVKGTDIVATVVLAKLTKLRQIAAGFVYKPEGGVIRFEKNPKLAALQEVLEEIMADPLHKVVIWTSFKEELEMVTELCGLMKIRWTKLESEMNARVRDSTIQAFQQNPEIKVFVSSQHVGGIGLNLTAADYCIFFSNDYSHEVRAQAEDRLHRIGQKKQVVYVDLIMKGTLDSTIRRMLTNKANLAASLVPSRIEEIIFDDGL